MDFVQVVIGDPPHRAQRMPGTRRRADAVAGENSGQRHKTHRGPERRVIGLTAPVRLGAGR